MILGRYAIGESFASGGMGTVHLGRLRGAGGFSRVVAVKRLYPGFAGDANFREMLLDEARLASRIRHPNVVPTLDVLETDKDLYVVMEYVHGVSLDRLIRLESLPIPIATGIVDGVLAGLHAAHEARAEDGTPLGIVHRDVSPQNVLVGADGIPRLIDFGIAKAATRLQVTEPGTVKGRAGYMAPEQLLGEPVSRHADIFSSAVVLWEALTGRVLLEEHGSGSLGRRLSTSEDVPPSRYRTGVGATLDEVVLRALSIGPSDRFPTAEAMAVAIRGACSPAGPLDIANWLRQVAADDLELSDERVRLLEQSTLHADPDASGPSVIQNATDSTAATTSVTTNVPPRESGPRFLWRTAIVGGVVLAGAVAALALRAAWHHPVAAGGWAGASGAMNESPATAAGAGSPRTSGSSVGLGLGQPETPSAAPSVLPIGSSSVAVPGPAKLAPFRPGPGHRSGKAHCDPPYTVDANGRKHYDPACF